MKTPFLVLVSGIALALLFSTVVIAENDNVRITPAGDGSYFSTASPTDASEWSGWTDLGDPNPGGSVTYASATTGLCSRYPGELDVFWMHIPGFSVPYPPSYDALLREKAYTVGGGWSTDWDTVGAPLTNGTQLMSTTSGSSGRIDLWNRNVTETGDNLVHTDWSGGVWNTTWSIPDGVSFSGGAPSAVSPTATTQDIFWTSPDRHLRWLHWSGTG